MAKILVIVVSLVSFFSRSLQSHEKNKWTGDGSNIAYTSAISCDRQQGYKRSTPDPLHPLPNSVQREKYLDKAPVELVEQALLESTNIKTQKQKHQNKNMHDRHAR